MKRELMMFEETERRFDKHEDPLDLSIEKWRRIILVIQNCLRSAEQRCGLCLANDRDCQECPYECDNESGWAQFVRDPSLKNASKVLGELNRIKHG